MINERQLKAVSNAPKVNSQTVIYTHELDVKKMSALGIYMLFSVWVGLIGMPAVAYLGVSKGEGLQQEVNGRRLKKAD